MGFITNTLYNGINFNAGLYNGGSYSEALNNTDDIVFNEFGLLNSNVITQFFQDDSPPELELLTSVRPRGHGVRIQDGYFRVKNIPFAGILQYPTQAELETAMSLMRKKLIAINGDLKGVKGTRERYYIATLANPDALFAGRDHYHITWCPFAGVFRCYTPFGRSNERNVKTLYGKTSSQIDSEITNSGEVEARLQLFIQFASASSVTSVNIQNLTNGEQITITRSFAASELLMVDGENDLVQVDGSDVDFVGLPPNLDVGVNSIRITVTSSFHNTTITLKNYTYYS